MAGPDCPPSCRLYDRGKGFVTWQGTGSNKIALIGEAPGDVEIRMKQPFRGPAGLMLGTTLHRLGMDRDDFLIGNVLMGCQPPKNWLEGAPWEQDAIEHCRPYFDAMLEAHPQIRVLVPMGNVALHYLLGQKGVGNFHGTVHWSPQHERWVIPTFHPSYLMRGNWAEIQTVRFDLQRAAKLAQSNQHDPAPVNYQQNPSGTTAWEFERDYRELLTRKPDLVLAADIETAGRVKDGEPVGGPSWQITRISFSFREHEAITMPWEGGYIGVAKALLEADGDVIWWNGDAFDLPRMRYNGVQSTRNFDAMEGFHFLYPDLPKDLGYATPFFTDIAPWKHLSASDPTFYSCVDSDATLRNWNAIQQWIKDTDRWDSFKLEIMECNQRTAQMSVNGIAIDEPVRVAMVAEQETTRAQVAYEVQEQVPIELKDVNPKKGYKRPQPSARCQGLQTMGGTERLPHKITETCLHCEATLGWEPDRLPLDYRQITVDDLVLEEGTQVVRRFLRYAQVKDFNLNSPPQLIRYITWKHGKAAVPKAKKTSKPTTERDQIERLARKTGDPVLLLAIAASEVQSKISHLNGWAPGEDGFLHATFTNNPATFRLSSKGPNVHNYPGRTEEYQRMRRMVVPGAGYEWLVARDYTGIEAIQVGLYANDLDYIRLATRGVHAYLAMEMLGAPIDLGLSDSDLDLAIAEAKKRTQLEKMGSQSLYDAAKRAVHGTNYGMSPRMLMTTYPDAFPTTKDADRAQSAYFALFPKVRQWQNSVVDRAHKEAHLVNDFGYIRWFWFVKKHVKRRGQWVLDRGEDAKAAIATLPQSSAAIIMRRAICSKAAGELLEDGRLFLTIHDELIARAERGQAEWVNAQLRAAMEFEVPEQDNRVFRTTGKRGRHWGEMGD